MRYLSKISFINSANINWAEVKVDGNVQLIGTQGVGKSTLLRALVFFHTAAPGHLGINLQSQRRFQDFYFPSSHSYIIYEVSRGDNERPFSIIVSCVNRQMCFRFVDAPFRQSWIIDNTGVITGDQAEIRRRIQKEGIDVSNNIKTFAEYREILYGNIAGKTVQQRALTKYNLFRSPNYENVTRIIQNVFLNEIVEAGFIKDTIIQSMSGESEQEPFVHLEAFRKSLSDFKEVSKDLKLMASKDKQELAKKVIDIADKIYIKESEIFDLWGKFHYLCRRYTQLIPILKDELTQLDNEEQGINERIKKLDSDFGKEQSKLLEEIGHWSSRIKDTLRKKKEYEQYDMEDLIFQVSQEENIRERHRQISEVISNLKAKAVDIEMRYDNLIGKRRSQTEQYVLEQKGEILKEESNLQSTISDIERESNEECQAIVKVMEEREETLRIEINSIKEKRHQLENKRVEVEHSSPMSEEIEKIKEKLSDIASREKSLNSKEAYVALSKEKLESELQLKEKEIEEEYHPQITSVRDGIARIADDITKERSLLDNFKGSFAEWLDQNVEDWQNTIGYIADEKRILYNTTLSPSLDDRSPKDTFFGVSIDLSETDYTCRTPEELKENISRLNRQISFLETKLKELMESKAARINKCHKDFESQFKSLDIERHNINIALRTLPNEKNKIKVELSDVISRSNQQRQKQLDDIDIRLQEVSVPENKSQVELNECKKEKVDKVKEIEKKYRSPIKRHKEESAKRVKLLEKSIADATSQMKEEIKQLQEEKTVAMQNEGVDMKIIATYEKTLKEIENQLSRIKQYEKIVIKYQEDKKDFFDKEEDFRVNKKRIETSLENLEKKYNGKKKTQEDEQKKIRGEKNEKLSQIEEYKNGLKQAELFNESFQSPSDLNDHTEVHTSDNMVIVIGKLSKSINRHKELLTKDLEESISGFCSDFSQRDTFNILDIDRGNREKGNLLFAENLRNLIKKGIVEDILMQKSRIYKHILHEISREYSALCEKESEIQKIVNEVNYDLAHKDFAEVISSIEMRFNKKGTPLINVLDEILQFSNDNMFDLGSMNLFSFENEDNTGLYTKNLLQKLSDALSNCPDIERLTLSGSFSLQFRIEENGVRTQWLDNLKTVGSNGTGILAKAVINILLMYVFKRRLGKSLDKFRLHFMMDEMGTISAENIRGLLKFANERNIYIITASPQENNPLFYRHIYHLSKVNLKTVITPLLTTRQQALAYENDNIPDKETAETL